MKVVLFCGGLGTRIRDYAENVPKPMVPVGHSPILWHVMQYYHHYGHSDFVLCLGYKANINKRSPPQGAGYFRTERAGAARAASGSLSLAA
jgi:dTDP-glucose pyrophosphorylase